MLRDLRDAVLLAGAAMISSLPMFAEQYFKLGAGGVSLLATPYQIWLLAAKQAVMIFALGLPCALIGLIYAQRLGLPGIGALRDIPYWLTAGLLLGVLLTPVSYLLVDRLLIAAMPQLYPDAWSAALANMLGTSLPQEIIARLGLLTIAVYLLRWRGFSGHPWPAIAFLSIFGAWSAYLFLLKFKFPAPALETSLALLSAFIMQWLYGEVFVRWGFVAVVSIHFGLNVKMLLYAVLPQFN